MSKRCIGEGVGGALFAGPALPLVCLGFTLAVMGTVAVTGLFAVAGCEGRSVSAKGLDGSVDGGDGSVGEDAVAVDGASDVDGGESWCRCPDGPDPGPDDPVAMYHSCVPPMEHGCVAQVCTPGQQGQCGEGHTCEECGAAACCICAACVPACLYTQPTQGPLPQYLKLSNTRAQPGVTNTVSIQGFPFYVGALGYSVRLGRNGAELGTLGGGQCFLEVELPPREPGVSSVWVSSYGFGEPWVLAGFFFWKEDVDEWEECIQPGWSCGGGFPCCETPEVPMMCEAGRCIHAEH